MSCMAPPPCWSTPPAVAFMPLLTIRRWACSACVRNVCAGERQHLLHQRGNYIKFPTGVKKYIKFCRKKIKRRTARTSAIRFPGLDFHRNLLKEPAFTSASTASRGREAASAV